MMGKIFLVLCVAFHVTAERQEVGSGNSDKSDKSLEGTPDKSDESVNALVQGKMNLKHGVMEKVAASMDYEGNGVVFQKQISKKQEKTMLEESVQGPCDDDLEKGCHAVCDDKSKCMEKCESECGEFGLCATCEDKCADPVVCVTNCKHLSGCALLQAKTEDFALSEKWEKIAWSYKTDPSEPIGLTAMQKIWDIDETNVDPNPRINSWTSEISGDNYMEAAEKMSAEFGLDASYMAFSGSVAASVGSSSNKTERKLFAKILEYQPTVEVHLKRSVQTINQKIQEDWQKLEPEEIYKYYGEFYASQITLGGMLCYTFTQKQESVQETKTFAANVKAEAEAGVVSVNTHGDVSQTNSATGTSNALSVTSEVFGGDVGNFEQGGKFSEQRTKWEKTVTGGKVEAIKFKLFPLWEVVKQVDATKADKLEKLIRGIWKESNDKLMKLDEVCPETAEFSKSKGICVSKSKANKLTPTSVVQFFNPDTTQYMVDPKDSKLKGVSQTPYPQMKTGIRGNFELKWVGGLTGTPKSGMKTRIKSKNPMVKYPDYYMLSADDVFFFCCEVWYVQYSSAPNLVWTITKVKPSGSVEDDYLRDGDTVSIYSEEKQKYMTSQRTSDGKVFGMGVEVIMADKNWADGDRPTMTWQLKLAQ